MKKPQKAHVRKLEILEACGDSQRFAKQYPSPKAAWEHCSNLDWIVWLANRVRLPAKLFIKAALPIINPEALPAQVKEGYSLLKKYVSGHGFDKDKAQLVHNAVNGLFGSDYDHSYQQARALQLLLRAAGCAKGEVYISSSLPHYLVTANGGDVYSYGSARTHRNKIAKTLREVLTWDVVKKYVEKSVRATEREEVQYR